MYVHTLYSTHFLLLYTVSPSDGNELEEPNEKEREGGRELVPQLEEVDSIAQDEGETHQEHAGTDYSCRTDEHICVLYTVFTRAQ